MLCALVLAVAAAPAFAMAAACHGEDCSEVSLLQVPIREISHLGAQENMSHFADYEAASEADDELSQLDLRRATQVGPGPAFRAASADQTNRMLNVHLKRLARGRVKACEDFTVVALDSMLKAIKSRASMKLQQIYSSNTCPEGGEILHSSELKHSADWHDMRVSPDGGATIAEEVLAKLPAAEAHRLIQDKKCYDAAMAFVHGISDHSKDLLLATNEFTLPLLPRRAAPEVHTHLRSLLGVDSAKVATAFTTACSYR